MFFKKRTAEAPLKEPERKERKPVSKLRFTFMVGLIGIGVALGFYVNTHSPHPAVLGETTTNTAKPITLDKTNLIAQLQTAKDSSINIVKGQGDNLKQLVSTQVEQTIGNVASKSADTVTDIIFQNTVGNVLKQINKLPQRQQEEVRKAICK